MSGSPDPPPDTTSLILELMEYFESEGIMVHGARGVQGHSPPPPVSNTGFGDGKPRVPDVAGLHREQTRIVFGVVRPTRESLDSEDALTEYNVFLDHNAAKGEQSSLLYVIMPPELLTEFTSIITHYIHREYWHRVLPIASRREQQ